MSERCKHCGRTIVLWGGSGKLWVHRDDDHPFCSMDDDDNNDRAEPSPEPEAAPASEAQAPAVCGALHTTTEGDVYACVRDSGHEDYHSSVRDSIRIATGGVFWWDRTPRTQAPAVPDGPIDHRRNCPAWTNAEGYEVNGEDCTCGKRWRIDIQTLHELRAAWEKRAYESEAEVASLREKLARAEARVAILDAQEVELPELPRPKEFSDYKCGFLYCSASGTNRYAVIMERQLLGAQRAVQAQRTIMRDLRNGLVAARDFIDSGNSGWFPQQWRDAIAAYDALAGKGE